MNLLAEGIHIQLALALSDSNSSHSVTHTVQRGDQHLDGTVDGQDQGVGNEGLLTGEAHAREDGEEDDGTGAGSGGSAHAGDECQHHNDDQLEHGDVIAAADAAEYGIPVADFVAAYVVASDAESYKDKKGETVDNSKSLKIAASIYDLGLSDAQTKKLMEDLGVNKTVRGWNEKLVRNKLAQMDKKYG